MKTTRSLDYAEAKKIVDTIVEEAVRRQKAVVVAVADPYGELIALARMDGVPLPSLQIAANKAWSAARAQKTTREIGERVRDPEHGHDIAYYGDRRFIGWGGGIPIRSGEELIGSIAVSGLTSEEDIALAILGATTLPVDGATR